MIYAELSGGLGNQMFVYAFARAMGLCCQEPVTLIDRQDWKTGSPAHTALALQALHISSEVQFITDAGFAKQHLPVQNAAKALMIRHEQRVGLMDRDWHPFEARMAPMLNAIGLHFATEGFTPAKRGHAKNFLAWGYFQGADYFKDQAETIRAELLPIETRNTALPLRPPPLRGKLRQARSPSACIGAAVTICCRRTRPCRSARRSITPPPAVRCAKACPRRNCLSFQMTPPMCGSIWTLRACRCITAPGQKVPRRTLP